MTTALLPIHPRHVEGILARRKTVEIRRTVPKRDITRLVIYETAPSSRVVADCRVRLWIGSPDAAERRFRGRFGVSVREFRDYVSGRPEIAVLEIDDVIPVDDRCLRDYGLNSPPQSWVYLD